MIYLAQPYSNNPEASYEAALRYVAEAFPSIIFSPIIHYHEVARKSNLPGDFSYWAPINRHFLVRSSELRILMLPGWESSRGVIAEMQWARELQIPIRFASKVK